MSPELIAPTPVEKRRFLLDELESLKRQAHDAATQHALEFVRTGEEPHRANALRCLRDAELWNDARKLAIKHL